MKRLILPLLVMTLLPLTALASEEMSETKVTRSVKLNGLKISREKESVKSKDGTTETTMITAVDLLGSDGRSALPWVELGLEIDNIVIYAYPNAAPGGRELWFGLKLSPSTEAGFLVGTNHLAFNPSTNINGKDVKTDAMDRIGFFINHRQEFNDLTFDLSLTPFYALSSSTYTYSSLNQRSDELGISAEMFYLWETLPNVEISSGAGIAVSQSHKYLGGSEFQTVNWSDISVTLAQTKFNF